MMKMNKLIRKLVFCLYFSWAAMATAEIVEITVNDDLQAAINNLQAGDELWLGGGTYSLNSRIRIDVTGRPDQPVVIRAKAGEITLIDMPTDSQNIVEIQNSTYLKIQDLRFRGGSHGLRLMNSDFITIENCEIYETGDVAISANSGGTYEGLVIRGNHIHDTNGTGEGLYLGCNNDACRVMNSLIEQNYIHHTNGPSVEQGDGIEIKEGSSGNIIRHNVIHDTNYPGIVTYSTVGNGPQNLIEGNVIWNTADYAIQSAADTIIRNNIILGGPIALQSHQAGSPSNLEIVHNTIVTDGSGVAVRSVTGPVLIANNAIYSQSGTAIRLISGDISLVTVAGNVGSGGIAGANGGIVDGNGISADFVNGHYDGAPPIDLFPAPGSALITAGNTLYETEFDFNGSARNGVADAGAYHFDANGNPGWVLVPGFKRVSTNAVAPNPPTDLTVN